MSRTQTPPPASAVHAKSLQIHTFAGPRSSNRARGILECGVWFLISFAGADCPQSGNLNFGVAAGLTFVSIFVPHFRSAVSGRTPLSTCIDHHRPQTRTGAGHSANIGYFNPRKGELPEVQAPDARVWRISGGHRRDRFRPAFVVARVRQPAHDQWERQPRSRLLTALCAHAGRRRVSGSQPALSPGVGTFSSSSSCTTSAPFGTNAAITGRLSDRRRVIQGGLSLMYLSPH